MRTGPVRPSMSLPVGTLLLVLGAVGVLDAAIGAVWDLVVLFAAVMLIGVVGIVAGATRRRPVTLRADLALELESRGRPTGEQFEQVLDRAVATYLRALEDRSTSST